MNYLMLVCIPADSEPPLSMRTDTAAWTDEMEARGVRVFGQELAPLTDATTVRVRAGEVALTDGP